MKKIRMIKENELFTWGIGDEFEVNRNGMVFLDRLEHTIYLTSQDLIDKGYARWVEDKPKGRWEPEKGDEYYYIDYAGDVEVEPWWGCWPDIFRYSQGNCFKTEKEAERHWEFLVFQARLREISDGFQPNWNDHDQEKWFIYFNHSDLKFCFSFNTSNQNVGEIYFPRREKAEEAYDMANENYIHLFKQD